MANYYKHLPPAVLQDDPELCWAAALESWQRAIHRPKYTAQADLPVYFAKFLKPGTHILKQERLKDVALDHRIAMHLYDFDVSVIPKITAGGIAAALSKSHLFMARLLASDVGHCFVIYGIGFPDGKKQQIAYMDPMAADGYDKESLSDLHTSKKLAFGSTEHALNFFL